MKHPEIVPYRDNPDFKKLDRELISSMPNFKAIEEAIFKTPPVYISSAILDDVGFVYLIDYYLRYMSETTIKKLLQSPVFSKDALVELFYCQVTAYHKAILQKKPLPELISSYWTYLTKAEFAILFKHLIKQTTNVDLFKNLLLKVDLVHLRMMTKSGTMPSSNVLNFLRRLGPEIKKVVAHDMHIYDFAFDLAVNHSDTEFLNFLEEYTSVFVQLRVASFLVEEIEKEVKLNGKLNYMYMLEKSSSIPRDSLELTLGIFKEKGWISENEAKTIYNTYQK
ncbi:MAG: hypothetical protein SFU98_01770 [Leptospiraceae bacterium]|nr:hypothetical protein [Leptospiraceae bacterium]